MMQILVHVAKDLRLLCPSRNVQKEVDLKLSMQQLTVYADNKPGSMYKILNILSNAKINVRSVSTERGNMNEIRLIVGDVESAKAELEAMGVTSHIVEIVVVELTDKPGELARIASILDKSGVNIEYMYGVDNSQADRGLFAIKTSTSPDELRNLLSSFSLL